ncbi:hypothetical protein BLNAU_1439 [Blattamonas nauphoetae]|uniref:Uncharacterized protein n=1 Tax=Blattamonas nauphoetae TaxID=2049346 RepID=A0ABQ9YI51_9EUKA|nr:hypothetical protein BLNAU_1439 [Blattamonas nauphoetae]
MKLIQTKLLTEPQHTPTPEDLYIEFITGILGHFFERTNITCSSSEMNNLTSQILDIYRPLSHSSFFAMIWDKSSSYATYPDVSYILMHNEQVFFHLSESKIDKYAAKAFVKQIDYFKCFIESHRSEWLFSDFLAVLQQLSKGNDNTGQSDFANGSPPIATGSPLKIALMMVKIEKQDELNEGGTCLKACMKIQPFSRTHLVELGVAL